MACLWRAEVCAVPPPPRPGPARPASANGKPSTPKSRAARREASTLHDPHTRLQIFSTASWLHFNTVSRCSDHVSGFAGGKARGGRWCSGSCVALSEFRRSYGVMLGRHAATAATSGSYGYAAELGSWETGEGQNGPVGGRGRAGRGGAHCHIWSPAAPPSPTRRVWGVAACLGCCRPAVGSCC